MRSLQVCLGQSSATQDQVRQHANVQPRLFGMQKLSNNQKHSASVGLAGLHLPIVVIGILKFQHSHTQAERGWAKWKRGPTNPLIYTWIQNLQWQRLGMAIVGRWTNNRANLHTCWFHGVWGWRGVGGRLVSGCGIGSRGDAGTCTAKQVKPIRWKKSGVPGHKQVLQHSVLASTENNEGN